MPDIGQDGHEARSAPPQWSEAFAVLPLESPAPRAWQRLQARLPERAKMRRRRWPLWLATAASLALVMAIPLRTAMRNAAPAQTTLVPAVAANTWTAKLPRRTSEPSGHFDVPSIPTPAPTHIAPEPRDRTPAHSLASAPRTRRDAIPHVHRDAGLEALYAESAQLETLLAAARDDRTASSGTAALTDSLDAELAAIDAALVQPGLGAPRRTGLWRQRVDTLRQLAGIETTRRLLSARGETYDAALVSID